MPRVPRSALPGGFFHVYCRGVAGIVALPDGDDRTELFRLIGVQVRRHRLELYAACALSTHYHLVLDGRVSDISRCMHQVNWRYARYFNEKHERFGHVFAERFGTRALEGEDRVFDTCAYVLQNPVKARLCQRIDEWPWSYCRYGLGAV